MITAVLFSSLVTAMAVMLAFPRTPSAKYLHRVLVELPARYLFDMSWKRAGLSLLLTLAFVAFALMGPEMMMMFAAMGADAAAVELMIIVWAASVSGGFAGAWRTAARIGNGLARLAKRSQSRPGRPRPPRSRPKSRPKGSKDDADGPEWAFA